MICAAMASKASLHIKSLDGIRALAALLVFIAHAGLDRLVPGGFGVTIFFFLSGYLITTLLRLEWHARYQTGKTKRGVPIHWLTANVIAVKPSESWREDDGEAKTL